jgi:hypothetical protein
MKTLELQPGQQNLAEQAIHPAAYTQPETLDEDNKVDEVAQWLRTEHDRLFPPSWYERMRQPSPNK